MESEFTTSGARAIDLGAANTKLTTGLRDNWEPQCMKFRSVAPIGKSSSLGAGVMSKRDCKLVRVGDHLYEVGPGAAAGQVSYAKKIDMEYCKTDTYEALMKGALLYCGAKTIPMLGLGLPITTYWRMGEWLKNRYTGEIDTGAGIVNVQEVVVMPQPLGGFYNFAVSRGMLGRAGKEITLMIDPGGNTLDWLLVDGDNIPIEDRSGAAEQSGVFSVLNEVVREMARQIGDIGGLDRLDKAVYSGEPVLKVGGKDVELAPYLRYGESIMEQAIAKMFHSVRSIADIDNVVIIGGGAEMFRGPMQKHFSQTIQTTGAGENAIWDNVKGFHYVAAEMHRRRAMKRTVAIGV